MTLQQLRYLIAVAEYGSINAAANNIFASQSNLSTAIQDLEQEFGITIFTRSNRGVTLTNDGTELLAYARQVIEQADMLEERYGTAQIASASARAGASRPVRLAISSQHYYFSVQAFTMTCEEFEASGGDSCDFILRECATGQIIDDVRTFRSELGILYVDSFNQRVLEHAFEEANVYFTPLFEASPHIFVGKHHPLAKSTSLTLDDLAPYPRYSFEQGTNNSFYYAEEPFAALPHKKNVRYSDRGTLTNLLTHYNGYTVSTGVLSEEMLSGIVSIPLQTDALMRVGYIMHKERKPSQLLVTYIKNLHNIISNNVYVNRAFQSTH